jgi:hypothetical protein
MSKKPPAKGEAENFQGPVPKGTDAQTSSESKNLPAKDDANRGLTSHNADPHASRERAETRDGFDDLLQQLSTVIGIDDVLFCKGLLEDILWLFQDRDGKFNGARFGLVIAYLQANKPRNRDQAFGKVHVPAHRSVIPMR